MDAAGPAVLHRDGRAVPMQRLALALLGVLAVLLGYHAVGAVLDYGVAVRSPFEADYGEGIVWQQAALMPGPRAYPTGTALPFIVFHYPPLFHMLARAVATGTGDLLAAGRMVAGGATLLLVPLVAALAALCIPAPARRSGPMLLAAGVAGLLAITMESVHLWGGLMRVDMPGLALGFAGLLVAARADGRFGGTVLALLLCLLAVFTKQTLMTFGVAVFAAAVLQRPRQALLAALLVGAVGVAAVLVLQRLTGGGFLQNIVGYNINRFALRFALWPLWAMRDCLCLMTVAGAAALGLAVQELRSRLGPPLLATLRQADVVARRRLLVLLHFGLASLMLATLFKGGASVNYLTEWSVSAALIAGVALADLVRDRRTTPAIVLAAALLLGAALVPAREFGVASPEEQAARVALTRRIAEATSPVLSENMVLLMQAGKPVVAEPAIVTELALLGRWDETPLVETIRARGFAFILITDPEPLPNSRRTPAVNAAMLEAYPTLRRVGLGLWVREP